LLSGGGDEAEAEKTEVVKEAPSSMVELDPFVLNLSDHGRYLKVTLQFEISDPSHQNLITNKTPQLRDTIITLVSSKSLNSISSAEGKFQLKDELLFRANQIIGMEVFSEDGTHLGQVTGLLETKANNVFIVDGPLGEVLLPDIEDVVIEVDIEQGRLLVHLLDGLIP